MDYFQSQTLQHPLKCKKRLTQDQVMLLEISFNFNNKLDSGQKSQLAQQLGVPPKQVAVWYQNKRARWKSQTLEEKCKSLKHRLESVLKENERLEREIERLKQDMTLVCNIPSLSSSCDEVGSSSLKFHGQNHHHMDKEIYACFIGGEGGEFERPEGHNFFDPSISL
ncbi:homeobox-leucine zipper protein ATHB-52-like [Actinidia eriantha]|uniref:homeobox-leucine zipper protein ATHB-52-like n=1 Tax=Actinidia eriantha TaxID=165200 RepID=UPI0025870B57|nr:homeobox-leucine zipper protein ATHB-52-like [Actinidia eriantha]XP_057471310.1 homeobox-leucine zipper protein ATHB-52-like [Actinidia eriantha]